MGLKERLIDFIEYIGIEKAVFERTVGLSNDAVNKMGDGTRRSTLDKISNKYPELNINWLRTGEGSMLKTETQYKSDVRYIAPYLNENLINVPYVPQAAIASFVESLYDMEYDLEEYGIRPEEDEDLQDGTYIVFDVAGDSMYPTLSSGTKILCKRISEGHWEYANGVVVIVYGKTLTVKRVLKNNLFGNNSLTLKADNPQHGQLDVERREIRSMWQAIRIVSQKIV